MAEGGQCGASKVRFWVWVLWLSWEFKTGWWLGCSTNIFDRHLAQDWARPCRSARAVNRSRAASANRHLPVRRGRGSNRNTLPAISMCSRVEGAALP